MEPENPNNENNKPSSEETVYEPIEPLQDEDAGYGGFGEALVKPLPAPMRLIFGDMAGVVFLVWFPIMAAFLIPWSNWIPLDPIVKDMNLVHVIVALIIALPPWIILMIHLKRGHLWDGILDMFLWAIWESIIMITLCYLYPGHAEKLIWHAPLYWDTMNHWISTGMGPEGDPSIFIPLHLEKLLFVIIGALLMGLPALMLGVLQLNFMNYYVAQCMALSDNALLTLPIAWHFWSVIRVMGFITISSSLFQMVLKIFRAPVRAGTIWWGLAIGLILVVADIVLKALFAEEIRIVLRAITGL